MASPCLDRPVVQNINRAFHLLPKKPSHPNDRNKDIRMRTQTTKIKLTATFSPSNKGGLHKGSLTFHPTDRQQCMARGEGLPKTGVHGNHLTKNEGDFYLFIIKHVWGRCGHPGKKSLHACMHGCPRSGGIHPCVCLPVCVCVCQQVLRHADNC